MFFKNIIFRTHTLQLFDINCGPQFLLLKFKYKREFFKIMVKKSTKITWKYNKKRQNKPFGTNSSFSPRPLTLTLDDSGFICWCLGISWTYNFWKVLAISVHIVIRGDSTPKS